MDVTARVDFTVDPPTDGQFYVLPGMADAQAVSIEAANMPGYFLQHQNNAIVFAPNDGTAAFAEAATWWLRPGLADKNWMSFESYNQPGSYIGQKFGVMALVKLAEITTERARNDATFMQE
jgi:hypothetical protein